MQNIQEKIKSIALVGLFVCLFLAFSLSGPTPAAAAVETVSTQVTYQSQAQVVNTEMTYHIQVVSDLKVETQSFETESLQLEVAESDDGWSWANLVQWFKKVTNRFPVSYSFAWSG